MASLEYTAELGPNLLPHSIDQAAELATVPTAEILAISNGQANIVADREGEIKSSFLANVHNAVQIVKESASHLVDSAINGKATVKTAVATIGLMSAFAGPVAAQDRAAGEYPASGPTPSAETYPQPTPPVAAAAVAPTVAVPNLYSVDNLEALPVTTKFSKSEVMDKYRNYVLLGQKVQILQDAVNADRTAQKPYDELASRSPVISNECTDDMYGDLVYQVKGNYITVTTERETDNHARNAVKDPLTGAWQRFPFLCYGSDRVVDLSTKVELWKKVGNDHVKVRQVKGVSLPYWDIANRSSMVPVLDQPMSRKDTVTIKVPPSSRKALKQGKLHVGLRTTSSVNIGLYRETFTIVSRAVNPSGKTSKIDAGFSTNTAPRPGRPDARYNQKSAYGYNFVLGMTNQQH